MASIYKKFETNKERETKGITVEYHDDENPEAPPAKFVIARSGGSNAAYAKMLDVETKPLRRSLAAGTIPVATMQRISRKCFVETCLLGWENVIGKDNKPIPFSKTAASQLFEDLPDLAEDLMAQASNASLFRYDEEVDSGN